MCIIVDTNSLSNVFDSSSVNHAEFKPILDWVLYGKGTLVFGGSKYIDEVGQTKYMRLLIELANIRKAKNVNREEVDEKQAWAETKIQHKDFDDPHLIGLLLVSGCKLICSLDGRAYRFLRHNLFFPKVANKPKIYCRGIHSTLLTDANIADICKPIIRTTVAQRAQLSILK